MCKLSAIGYALALLLSASSAQAIELKLGDAFPVQESRNGIMERVSVMVCHHHDKALTIVGAGFVESGALLKSPYAWTIHVAVGDRFIIGPSEKRKMYKLEAMVDCTSTFSEMTETTIQNPLTPGAKIWQ